MKKILEKYEIFKDSNLEWCYDLELNDLEEGSDEYNKKLEDTIKNLKKVKINVLNFSRFWLRIGTPADKMYSHKDFIEGKESKRRAAKLKEEFEKIALENNKKWINWQGEARIIEKGKNNTLILRNDYYKPIYIKDDNKLKLHK